MSHFPPIRQRGFSLVTAIFLLVVLAGLAVAMVNLSTFQQTGSAMDVQGARVTQAARTGLEWGLYQQLRVNTGGNCFADTSFALPAGSSLSTFTVSVQCRLTTSPGTLRSWQITATACNQPGAGGCPNAGNNADYIQRRMQAVLSD
ncbi:agglutinin biogenesis protein MshP [Janthinobacterium sp.]|uniref:pilus assembly PilX family protein n=1 Tax=Janthinobacterium sp. TaxID=1871054 RepID=UPI002625CBFF|nr:agglutinin biogenesis protein MshP [Janthinobacterium sp.]